MEYKYAAAAAEYVQSHLKDIQVDLAVLTGTGMAGVDSIGEKIFEINYGDIPHFPKPTVESHQGILSLIKTSKQYVLVFAGRFHYYEGYESWEVCFPIYLMKLLKVQELIMTNASGGLNEAYAAGDLIVVNDHLNFLGTNPLKGKNDDRLGIRFPDMSKAYDLKMRIALKGILGDDYKEGVYAAMLGPSLETPAEYKFLHSAGADLVGMSTVPEVIAAVHAGLRTAVISVVSNMCYPVVETKETTIEEVIEVVQSSNEAVVELIKKYIHL